MMGRSYLYPLKKEKQNTKMRSILVHILKKLPNNNQEKNKTTKKTSTKNNPKSPKLTANQNKWTNKTPKPLSFLHYTCKNSYNNLH